MRNLRVSRILLAAPPLCAKMERVLTLNLGADADAAQDMAVIYLEGFELPRQRMSHVIRLPKRSTQKRSKR